MVLGRGEWWYLACSEGCETDEDQTKREKEVEVELSIYLSAKA